MDWQTPQKPAELTYSQLVSAILNGTFPPGKTLPAERQLAEHLGVTRPTLREALQRLSADGWVDIQQGKSTRVKNIWEEGSLNTLGTLVQHVSVLPEGFIENLLRVRIALAPCYTREAVKFNHETLVAHLDAMLSAIQNGAPYAQNDWSLHHLLTILSGNPIYTLILNGFKDIYFLMAEIYFQNPDTRDFSNQFYQDLRQAALRVDHNGAFELVQRVMERSLVFWQISAQQEKDQ